MNPTWILVDVQTWINPSNIPLSIQEQPEVNYCNTIKVKMRRNPSSVGLETYEFKMTIFENGKPEELFQFLKNFKNLIDGMGTISVVGSIYLLCELLSGYVL